jgi:hypothetical protein
MEFLEVNAEAVYWAIKNNRLDALEFAYNENQFSRAHKDQYNSFIKAAQNNPNMKAWFASKKPMFMFD